MRPQGEKPAAGARHARLSFDRPSPSEENNKPASSLRQRLEEAGIDVLPSEDPTREVFTRGTGVGNKVTCKSAKADLQHERGQYDCKEVDSKTPAPKTSKVICPDP